MTSFSIDFICKIWFNIEKKGKNQRTIDSVENVSERGYF